MERTKKVIDIYRNFNVLIKFLIVDLRNSDNLERTNEEVYNIMVNISKLLYYKALIEEVLNTLTPTEKQVITMAILTNEKTEIREVLEALNISVNTNKEIHTGRI